MGSRLIQGAIAIADDDPRLATIEALALRGHIHDALRAAESIGPLASFAGSRARCTAAWLLDHLGDSPTAQRWHVAELKKDREHPVVRYFYTFVVLNERGPVHAWLSIKDYAIRATATAEQAADIYSLKARLLAFLGDERHADAELARCDAEAIGLPRYASTRASLLERRQRRPEAIAILQDALAVMPLDRILVAHLASLLEAENRRPEALALLQRVEPQLQTPALASQRAALESELLLLDTEFETLNRLEQLEIKASAGARRVLALRRAENCYLRGELATAVVHARASKEKYWTLLADRLEGKSGPVKRRVIDLPVSIQEPMGCAPTSVALVANYFGAGVSQVDIADQICYEGTSAHSERAWVEARGWVSREFTVNFAIACELVQRGVPFLLVTVDIASAHAQVVVGCDETRNTLITRDPSSPRLQEMDVDKMLEQHRAYGPRGHVLLPPDKLGLLEGLTLPEQELHDLAHRFRQAVEANDEARAEARLAELEALAPAHQLALWARRSLAVRNQDPYAIRACSAAILERFPDDANAELSVLSCLSSIGTEAEQRERIQKRLAAGKAPWIFYERFGDLLAGDASEYPRARRAIRRALRSVPLRGRSLASWAKLERESGNDDLARALSRVAATLEPTDDDLARAHFQESFSEGDFEAALLFLRDRAERYRERSSEPLCVLFGALEWLERAPEAFEALDAGLERRPNDGQLLLFAAEAYARYRKRDRAEALLARASGKVSGAVFEQHAARLAELDGNLPEALQRYRAAHEALPLSLNLNEAIAHLLSELSGPAAARDFLSAACRAYPTHCGLLEMHIRWLRGHDPAHVLPELGRLLTLQPAHVWAKRERAMVFSDLGDHDRAIAEAAAARAIAPNQAASQRIFATSLAAVGRRAEAIAPAKQAIELWPDGPGAVSELLQLAGSLPEQLELIDWAWRELREHSVTGDGLLEWHGYLSGLVSEAELLERVRPLAEERPALWASHHVVAQQLLRTGQAVAARELLEAATARFPFTPRLHLDLADACHALNDAPAEARAAEAALRVNPGWITAVLRVADAHQNGGEIQAARERLERGLNFHPRSALLMAALARLSWRQGHVQQALQEARRAVEFQPADHEAWQTYAQFAGTLKDPEQVTRLGRELTAQRPWNARIWLRLAELLADQDQNLASIAALHEALEREPDAPDAIVVYAQALTRIGKKTEALAACERPVTGYFARGALGARRAWVLWEFGDRDEACLAMRKVLTEHPDQLWGHRELVSWEMDREQYPAAVRLARELTKLSPLNAVSHGYLGIAERKSKNTKAAWRAFSDAARIDPAYDYAGQQRIELAIAGSRLDDAAAVIAEQGAHVAPHIAGRWRIALACAREDVPAAIAVLREIALHPATPEHAFAGLGARLERLDRRALRHAFSGLVREAGMHRELGNLWVYALHASGGAPSLIALMRLQRANPSTYETAARAYFEILGERSASWFSVLFPLIFLGRSAHKSDEVWGKVGYALAAARAYVATQLWLAGYAHRRSIEAWMLQNYRVAALENGQPRAALRAVEHALALPADNTLAQLLAFAAFGRVVSGNAEGAREILEGRTADGLTGRNHWLFESARLLLELADSRGETRAENLAVLRERILGSRQRFSLFSTGTLSRWLAAGVLRQQFDLRLFVFRWWVWLALALACGFLAYNDSSAGSWLVVVSMVLAFYFVKRLRI